MVNEKSGIELRFALKRWSAWYPDLQYFNSQQAQQLSGWPNGRNLASLTDSAHPSPNLDFLPIMQRRRLTHLARAALAVAFDCWDTHEQTPIVFCSTHGETSHCFAILEQLADNRDVSPTQFALSVHSGIASMFSIYTGNHAPCQVLAVGDENHSTALYEAMTLLDNEYPQILIVLYDQPIPETYQSTTVSPSIISALALKLGKADSNMTLPILTINHGDQSEAIYNGKSLQRLIQNICSGHYDFTSGQHYWRLRSRPLI
ncbi:MAG: beta-ketoacyl synthase chain length factor [Gammaproteobacteria bacterium]|nr:beta-ketoacyl synthase chain length factor [Gammaproteobacteria bacterium]